MPALNLKEIRKALKLSQYDLAKLSGVERRTIMAHELGRKRLSYEDYSRVKKAVLMEKDRMEKELQKVQFGNRPE